MLKSQIGSHVKSSERLGIDDITTVVWQNRLRWYWHVKTGWESLGEKEHGLWRGKCTA